MDIITPTSVASTTPTINDTNFHQTLAPPTRTDTIEISSDASLRSYNGLYHTFILPHVGDYASHFTLRSNYLLRGFDGHSLLVDSLVNYLVSVSLVINNNDTVIARLTQFSTIDRVTDYHCHLNTPLNFVNLPILTKCPSDCSSYQVILRFNNLHR